MSAKKLAIILAASLLAAPVALADCGQVSANHKGKIPEWPKDPVRFECSRGFSELSLCIINRKGVEWLKNAGTDFIAINDGDAVYALTRESHPAHPAIVRRGVKTDPNTGDVVMDMSACGYGDKTAFNRLMKQYEEMNQQMREEFSKPKQ